MPFYQLANHFSHHHQWNSVRIDKVINSPVWIPKYCFKLLKGVVVGATVFLQFEIEISGSKKPKVKRRALFGISEDSKIILSCQWNYSSE